MGHHAVIACLVVLLAFAGASGAATEPQRGYRLAGVLVAGDGYLGFLELPDGSQVLVRRGSVVDGGTVIAFDARSLRIRFAEGVLELALEGSSKPAPPPAQVASDVVVDGDEQGHVIRREVDVRRLDEALDGPAAGNRKPPAAGPAASPGGVVAQRFAPLLDLPADARVVAVNEQRVVSADGAVTMVEDTLAKGLPARLNLQTSDGMKRVYLMPSNGSPPDSKRH